MEAEVAERLETAERKLEDLAEIAKHASSEKDKNLLREILGFLKTHRTHLKEANDRLVAAEARVLELEEKNRELEKTIAKKEYQLEHLASNMAAVLDKRYAQ